MTTALPSKPNFISLFEQLSKTISVLAAIMLMMSVCYDYAFLHALGLSFNEIPSTTAEHVRSALLWVPYMLLMAAGAAFQEFLARRAESKAIEDEVTVSVKPKTRRFHNWKTKALSIPFILVLLTAPFTSVGFGWVYILLAAGWVWLTIAALKKKRTLSGFSIHGILTFVLAPMIFGWVAYLGNRAAINLFETDLPKWEITLRIGNNQSKQYFLGMRRFSSFAIAVDTGRSVIVIPNDAVLSAKKLEAPLSNRPMVCYWLGTLCPSTNKNTPGSK
jgi:hypothetical protein